MNKTKIEWTNITWNPTTGCSKISSGCKNCYAEKMAYRLKSMHIEKYKKGFEVCMHNDLLNTPFTWKTPKLVFVNSMSDLFHENISLDFIKKVFDVMNINNKHNFQILTKRADRLLELNKYLNWTNNIWMGVTIEDFTEIKRIEKLKQTNAKIKFLSCEPLLSSLKNIDFKSINWVIVGGESGVGSRPIKKEWVEEIKDNCEKNKIPFFFKQWGGINKKENGKLLNGKIYNEMPQYREN